ncbi:uncharacterized protein LOC117650948 [Thrips palmi]|uniref:Uncharacterized protein LOC117650948 n=1 Tax=Thrips palmi TaxID=161013 RepID=A0A6P8ZYK8_THRPL|nr:uncharacterized protein LOC117650948 [Thrips palmi]
MCRPLHLVLAVVAVLGVPVAAAQQAALCPQPKTQAGFLADSFAGEWHEMKRVPWAFDTESDGDCGTVRFSWITKNDVKEKLAIDNYYFMPRSVLGVGYSNRSVSRIVLSAVPDDIANGKFTATFDTQTAEEKRLYPPFKYWVLGTDYDSYAVVFSCQEPPGSIVPHINLWVLSMHPSSYTAEVDAKVTALITAAGLDPSILRPVQHQYGCPTIERCQQCNKPMNVDLEKLKGPWWSVQHSHYADEYDHGSCRSTQFVPESGGINLESTMIYKLTPKEQDTIEITKSQWQRRGDGSFDNTVGGVLCVQGTDYDSWAVVSVCRSTYNVLPVFPMRPFGVRMLASEGGVFVLSRKTGLTPQQQLEANKAVVMAGMPVAHMQATPSTPCPKALLPGSTASAGSTTKTPAVLLLSVLAAALGHLRPAQ